MNSTKKTHFYTIRTSNYLVLAILAIVGLSLTGCSNQMAIMQENQANLQVLVQENAHQLSDLVSCMEQSQQALKVTILNLRETTKQLSEDMTQVTMAHSAFKDSVQKNNAVIASRVTSVEEDQKALSSELFSTAQERQKLAASIDNEGMKRAELEQMVEDNRTVFLAKVSTVQDSQVEFQTELKSLKATIQTAVSDISAVAMAQRNLEETVHQTVAGQLAAMQEAQTQQQIQSDDSKNKIDKLLSGLAGLETNLTQLESILKEDIKDVSKAVELAGHKQEEFEGETSQQVVELQSNTQSMIDTLKAELTQVRTVVAEINAISVNTPEILVTEPSEEPAVSP
jgi:chromosome segregation ATPase